MTLPALRNRWDTITAVIEQFEPHGHDGHFVSTRSSDARRKLGYFLGSLVRDGAPTVPR